MTEGTNVKLFIGDREITGLTSVGTDIKDSMSQSKDWLKKMGNSSFDIELTLMPRRGGKNLIKWLTSCGRFKVNDMRAHYKCAAYLRLIAKHMEQIESTKDLWNPAIRVQQQGEIKALSELPASVFGRSGIDQRRLRRWMRKGNDWCGATGGFTGKKVNLNNDRYEFTRKHNPVYFDEMDDFDKPRVYILHPDFVISASDGDRHYVSYSSLVRLYGLNEKECYDARTSDVKTVRRMFDAVDLFPMPNGDYSLPKR